MIAGKALFINGDGKSSRDYCYVDNVAQANLLAVTAPTQARNQLYRGGEWTHYT